MAPHCSHFYVLVKRKPLNINLIHFDYLTLVCFIGIDKSQIIEIMEHKTSGHFQSGSPHPIYKRPICRE